LTLSPIQREILDVLAMVRPYDAAIPKIRVGGPFDGGYVINDDLEGMGTALCLGVGNDVSFDLDLAQRGIHVIQYDPNVGELPQQHPLFHFRKMAWGDVTEGNARTLGAILAADGLQNEHDMLLKFDVEGAEWNALMATRADLLAKFRIITAEFHCLESIGIPAVRKQMRHAFALLTENHVPTHIHPNSTQGVVLIEGIVVPKLLEVSFLRSDRSPFIPSIAPIPGPLDAANADGAPDMVLTPFSHGL